MPDHRRDEVLSTSSAGTPSSTSSTSGTASAAKEQAGAVAQSASESTKQVAGTAKQEAGNVLAEGKQQAKGLTNEVRTQLTSRVDEQRSKAASVLRTTGEELSLLADKDQQSALTAQVAQFSSQRVAQVADYLDGLQPEDLLRQLQSGRGSLQDFARRRPGMFLAGMALAGAVIGRVTRGAVAANTSVDSGDAFSAFSAQGDRYTGQHEADAPGSLSYATGGTYAEGTTPGTYAGTTGYVDAGYAGTGYADTTSAPYPDTAYAAGSYTDAPATSGTYAGTYPTDDPYATGTAATADPYATPDTVGGTAGTTYTGAAYDEAADPDLDATREPGQGGTPRHG